MAKEKQGGISLDAGQEEKVLHTVANRTGIAFEYQETIYNDMAEYYQYYRGSEVVQDQSTWRARIHVPYIQQTIDTILPRLVSSKPKINVLPREESDVEGAQNNEKLIAYQWEKMRMFRTLKMWVKAGLIYGTSVVKIGWDFDRDNEKDGPWVNVVSNYDLFIDPNAATIDDAAFVIYKQERDFAEVKKNKNYINLDLLESAIGRDTKDEEKRDERNSIDRSEPQHDERKRVVIYEYYGKFALEEDEIEKDYFIVTANNEVLLRIEELKEIYPCGKPFVAFKDNDMPLDFWAIGEVEPLVPLSDELNTIRNQRLDNRKLIMNHMWLVNKNGGIEWDDFVSKPGGVISCNDTSAVVPLPVNDTTQNSVQEEAIIKQDMDRTSGVFQGMTGQLQGPVGGEVGDFNKTARGFLASIEQAGSRMQYKLDNLDDSIRELGQKMLKLNQKYITKDQVVRILGKTGVEFETIALDDIQKEYDLRVEGGATQPQNKEARKADFFQLMNVLVPLSQFPMVEYEPGEQPKATQMNVKYFIDNFLDTYDLPNKEEAFISAQDQGLPQVGPEVLGTSIGQPNEQQGQQIPAIQGGPVGGV